MSKLRSWSAGILIATALSGSAAILAPAATAAPALDSKTQKACAKYAAQIGKTFDKVEATTDLRKASKLRDKMLAIHAKAADRGCFNASSPTSLGPKAGGGAAVDPTGGIEAPTTTTVVYVTAGATGDGPADQAKCDRWANAINSWADASMESLMAGDSEKSASEWRVSESLTDEAQDDGCFIIYG